MKTDHNQMLLEIYKLHTELAERVASAREGVTKLFAGIVTSIVAASVLLHRTVPDAVASWVLPTLGILVSLSWMFALHSVTGRLSAKHEVLVALEEKLPFQFLKQENEKFDERRFVRRRYTGLLMPGAFLALCVVWLAVLFLERCGPS